MLLAAVHSSWKILIKGKCQLGLLAQEAEAF